MWYQICLVLLLGKRFDDGSQMQAGQLPMIGRLTGGEKKKGGTLEVELFAAANVLLLCDDRRVVVPDGHANVLDLVVVEPTLKVHCVFRLVVDDRSVGQHQRERAVRLEKFADFVGVILESCKIRFSE